MSFYGMKRIDAGLSQGWRRWLALSWVLLVLSAFTVVRIIQSEAIYQLVGELFKR